MDDAALADAGGDDDELMRACATELADAVERRLPDWVRSEVTRIAEAWQPGLAERLTGETEAAAEAARSEVAAAVRELLEADVDAQRTGPLDVLRRAVRFPTGVLAAAGIPEVERDEHAEAAFPDDPYDLTPAAFADLGPDVHDAGLRWGAAKAHTVLTRRRAEGRR